jgi:integrase/recombinase XerD
MLNQQLKASAYHLKPSEVNKVIFATKTFRDRCLIKALYWLGLRREEARTLDIRDIDFERGRVQVTGKGNKTRVIPIINEDFLGDLKHLIGSRKRGALFLSPTDTYLTCRQINYIVQKAGEGAGMSNPNPGLKNINPHIFRHSISRYLKSKNFSAEWIQNFLGHSSYKTTMDMYGTISIDEMQEEALKKLLSS